MVALHEQYRPRTWSDVVGQDKAITIIDRIRKCGGLGGRAYWISGASGTGKTTIGRLIAAEVGGDFDAIEIDGGDLTEWMVADLASQCKHRHSWVPYCLIVNEAHGLKPAVIRKLLSALEPAGGMPEHVVVIFTTTSEAQEQLFDDRIDSSPLLSRCTELHLSRRDLAKAFASRLMSIAIEKQLDGGQSIAAFVRLAQEYRNNFRRMLEAVFAGAMLRSSAAA